MNICKVMKNLEMIIKKNKNCEHFLLLVPTADTDYQLKMDNKRKKRMDKTTLLTWIQVTYLTTAKKQNGTNLMISCLISIVT